MGLTLEPVDGDPFATPSPQTPDQGYMFMGGPPTTLHLEPVEHDPFAEASPGSVYGSVDPLQGGTVPQHYTTQMLPGGGPQVPDPNSTAGKINRTFEALAKYHGEKVAGMAEPFQYFKQTMTGQRQLPLPGGEDAGSQEARDAAIGLGLNAVLAPMGAKGDMGTLRSFAGRGSKTADNAAFSRAMEMAAGGVHPEEIRQATGWQLDPRDGQWKYEVSDTGMKRTQTPFPEQGQMARAENLWEHPELYAAYPNLRNAIITPEEAGSPGSKILGTTRGTMSGTQTFYEQLDKMIQRYGPQLEGISPQEMAQLGRMKQKALSISLDPNMPPEQQLSTALHEFQHGVQGYEGFDKGVDIDAVTPAQAASVDVSPRAIAKAHGLEWDALLPYEKEQFINILNKEPDLQRAEAYRRSAGEVEARNVEKRMKMTSEERRQISPESTEDVPRSMQIKSHGTMSGFLQDVLGRKIEEGPTYGQRTPEAAPEPAADREPALAAGAGPGRDGGNPGLAEAQRKAAEAAGDAPKLEGLPDKPVDLGNGEYFVPGPVAKAHHAAYDYMHSAGLPYDPPQVHVKVDPERAARVAQAHEDMPHTPNDPATRASYEAMKRETLAQWEAIKKTGLKVEWIKPGQPDPYGKTPRLAQKDVIDNNHWWGFPTDLGLGTGPEAQAFIKDHPLLQPTGEIIDGKPVLVNDVFRIVHDYFGHIKDGNGFRASGEENAWRSHSAMYSDLARPAMTAETRGQNSWVNYGPHAEFNKTANGADTIYAPPKVGMMPDWAVNEGRGDPTPVSRKIEDPFAGIGHNQPPGEPLPVERTPPARRGISGMGLRNLPLDEAIELAKTQQHILKSNTREAYVGAPDWVKTPEDLAKMRADFDERAKAGLAGADWYARAQGGIKEIAGDNPTAQSLLARELALTSAQANPDTNLGFALAGHNAFEAGHPPEKIRTGQQARTYNEARLSGEPISLGKKTGVYAGHMDPTQENPNTGTNDIWHARALGYVGKDGKPWSQGLKPHQHAFMDAETLLAVDRANTEKWGGRSDWTPGEIQAAPWVGLKGADLAKKRFGGDLTKGIAEASKTYPDYFPKYTAYGTYEAVPGATTGQLPEITKTKYGERSRYSLDPRSSWIDSQGHDILYQAAGMYQRPSLDATGMYTHPTTGNVEINQARVARPMVGLTGPVGERMVDQYSKAMLDAVEATRAYIDAQMGGGWSKPIMGNKPGISNSLFIPHDKPMTRADMDMLREYGRQMGVPNVLDYGEGAALTNFSTPADPKALARALKASAGSELESTMGAHFPGFDPKRVYLEGGSPDFTKAWEQGVGTGAVTRQLQQYLTNPLIPRLLEKLDADPRIRQAALDRIDRDAEYGSRTEQPENPDVRLAREIIGRPGPDGGFTGLFKALKAGAPVPSILVAALLQEFLPDDEK